MNVSLGDSLGDGGNFWKVGGRPKRELCGAEAELLVNAWAFGCLPGRDVVAFWVIGWFG